MNGTRIFLAIGVAIASLSMDIRAECLAATVASRKQQAAFIFDGTVVNVEQIGGGREGMATVEVHRVWKGKVRKATTVYFQLFGTDGPSIRPNTRMVFFAEHGHPELDAGRKPAIRDVWALGCGWTVPFDDEANVKQLGRWRRPS